MKMVLPPAACPQSTRRATPHEFKVLRGRGCFKAATLIQAAGTAAKISAVQLLEVRPARAMGGKAFCTMTGDVSSVQAVVISRPHPDMNLKVV